MEDILFCNTCGAFRELFNTGEEHVTCRNCEQRVHIDTLTRNIHKIVEKVPIERSELLLKLYGKSRQTQAPEEAVIDEDCPKCAHKQMSFHTAQLRGVDEGQTIFYTCLNKKCGHKYTLNS